MINCFRRLLPAISLAIAVQIAIPDASAQTADFSRLKSLVKTNDIIGIVARDGTKTVGRVDAVDAAAIQIHPLTPMDKPGMFRESSEISQFSASTIASVFRSDAYFWTSRDIYIAPGTFGNLAGVVKIADTVVVIDHTDRAISGTVADLSPASLEIAIGRVASRTLHFSPDGVGKIQRPAHLWDGAVKGAVVALAIVGFTAAATCNGCTGLAPFMAMTTAIGAGIGVGIDALFPPRRIYRAPN